MTALLLGMEGGLFVWAKDARQNMTFHRDTES